MTESLSHPAGELEHKNQNLGDSLVELGGNLVADLDLRQRAGEDLVLLDRDVVGFCDLDDLLADRAAALGDDLRRARAVVMQGDGKLVVFARAHDARSRKRPALPAGDGGAPPLT